jgi:DNA repair protein RadA/Sms
MAGKEPVPPRRTNMSQMKMNVGLKSWKRGTNILDLEVPAQLEQTVRTGLKFFDEAMGGEGMTPSTAMLLTGTPGAGKTTMCLQLANAITASGNICLFNTAEESLFQVRKVAKRLGMQDGFVAGQDSLVADILEHADHLRKANKGKQVFLIIDSLQTLDDGKYKDGFTNSMSQVRATEMITNWCKENFGVAIIIGQVTKGGEFAGKQQIKHTVDAHAHLFIDDKKNSETFGERLFEVQKNRFGCSGKTFILGIEKKGLYEKGTISYND